MVGPCAGGGTFFLAVVPPNSEIVVPRNSGIVALRFGLACCVFVATEASLFPPALPAIAADLASSRCLAWNSLRTWSLPGSRKYFEPEEVSTTAPGKIWEVIGDVEIISPS